MTNHELAKQLRTHANRLQELESNLYRIRAYRRAAQTIEEWPVSVSELFEQNGRKALEDLPGVGSHLAFCLEGLLQTGELRTLTPTHRTTEPNRLLTKLPGVGPMLAHKIETQLGARTLDELERAVRQGRLSELGLGPKKSKELLEALDIRHEQPSFRSSPRTNPTLPTCWPSMPSINNRLAGRLTNRDESI